MDPIVKNITDAFTRIRAILFVNITICALIFANTYLENFSFDNEQILLGKVFSEAIQKDADKIKKQIESETDQDKIDELKAKLSNREIRVVRIENTIGDFKLTSVSVPVLGINVPSNDLVIIGGIFLVSMSIWLVFSINQINVAFRDEYISKIIDKNITLLRTSMMFVLPKGKKLLLFLALMIVSAPALTMTVATLNDLQSILFFDQKSALFHMFGTIVIRLMFLVAITTALWAVAFMAIRSWNALNRRLFVQSSD